MKNKKTAIIATSVIVLLVLCYFLFYMPYENQIAYDQNVACGALVTKAEASDETQIAQASGSLNHWIFDQPHSHFNKRLNTCLGDFSFNLTSTVNNATTLYLTKTISDVVNNKTLVTSTIGMSPATTTLIGGVSPDEFKQQEAILMSE